MTRLTFTALVLGILLLLSAVLPLPSLAATAVQVEFMANGVHDRDGNLLSGGKVWTYSGGTNLPKATYLDRAATTPASNPIVLDGEGKANIYAAGLYKFVVQDADGATIRIMDNFSYQDSSAALTSALTVSTTTDPQLTITNGAYSTTLGVSSVGETVLKPSNSFAIENATPQFILDNTSKQITMGMNASTGYLTLTPGLQLVNGAGSATIAADTASRLVISSPMLLQYTAGATSRFETTSTGDILLTTNNVITSADLITQEDLYVRGNFQVGSTVTGTSTTFYSAVDIPISLGSFQPPQVTFATAFTPDANWVQFNGTEPWIIFTDRVFLSGFITGGAGATTTLGTIAAAYAPSSPQVIIALAENGGATKAIHIAIGASPATVVATYLDGTAVAAGDTIYLNGLSYSK